MGHCQGRNALATTNNPNEMKDRTKAIHGKNYGSIPHLSTSKLGKHDRFIHEGQEQIILNGGRDKHDRITVTLKLDGTNVGVKKIDGRLVTIQRKGYDCASSPYRQHHEFDKWVHANYARFDSLLHEGDRIVGEWLWQASGIKYTVKGDPFFAFDYFPYYGGGKERMSRAAMIEYLEVNGPWIQTAPLLFDSNEGHANPLRVGPLTVLNHTSRYGAKLPVNPIDELHEGLMFRVERKGKFDFIVKWVRPDFVSGKYLPGLNGNPVGAPLVLNELA